VAKNRTKTRNWHLGETRLETKIENQPSIRIRPRTMSIFLGSLFISFEKYSKKFKTNVKHVGSLREKNQVCTFLIISLWVSGVGKCY
jgi:hypothetical protein